MYCSIYHPPNCVNKQYRDNRDFSKKQIVPTTRRDRPTNKARYHKVIDDLNRPKII